MKKVMSRSISYMYVTRGKRYVEKNNAQRMHYKLIVKFCSKSPCVYSIKKRGRDYGRVV